MIGGGDFTVDSGLRSDGDSCGVAESVGATALAMAAVRAVETADERPLIVDPYARHFLDAVGPGSWSVYFSPHARSVVDYTAARTAFFDEFVLSAALAGIGQVVILAAGLDTRAWRLAWPEAMTVFEVDQPRVLEFKTATLGRHGVLPVARVVGVGVDLRQDWPAVLQAHGFDDTAPAAWLVEGLVFYLPARAQDDVFTHIHHCSAPGSRVAVEAVGSDFNTPESRQRIREQMLRRRRAFAADSGRQDSLVAADLWYFDDKADVADFLRARGWTATTVTAEELLTRYRRRSTIDETLRSDFVTAQRP